MGSISSSPKPKYKALKTNNKRDNISTAQKIFKNNNQQIADRIPSQPKIENIAKGKHVCVTRGSVVYVYYFIIAKTKKHNLRGK